MNPFTTKLNHLPLFFQRNFFKRIVMYYIFTLMVLFFIFSVIITFTINNSYKDKMIELNETSLSQSDIISENIYGDIYLFTYDLYHNNENLLYLLFANEYNDLCSIKFNSLSSTLSSYSTLIHSCYLINLNSNFVCSNYGTYIDTSDFYDQDIINYLKNNDTSSSPALLIPRTITAPVTSSDPNPEEESVLSIIFCANTAGAFVINIDQTKALALLNSSTNSDLVENIVLNRYGQVLTSGDEYPFGSSMLNNTVYQKILDLNSQKGTFLSKINGTSYYISYYRSSSLGLVFIKLTKNLIFDTNNSLLVKAALYSAIFILFSFMLCFLLSFRLYRPVNLLTKNISSYAPKNITRKDEFMEISQTCQFMLNKNQHLENDMARYKNVSRARAIKELLDSNFASITPVQSNLYDFDLILDGSSYLVLLIGIDPDENSDSGYPDDSSLLLYSIYNIITELMSPYNTLECVDLNSPQLVCMVNIKNTSETPYLSHLKKAQNAMNEYFHVTFSCGVGNIVTDLENIKKSYQNAAIAFKHRFVLGYNAIILYKHLDFVNESEQVYPYQCEKDLLAAIRSMQKSKLELCVQDFFEKINHYYYNQIILYTLQLDFAVKQFALHYDLEEDGTLDFIDFSFQNKTLSQVSSLFVLRGSLLIDALSEIKAHKSEKVSVTNDVIRFVDKNIYNPNLTVELIAEEVHLSVNYLRNIFKKNMNESLSRYIIQKKLELICHLLIDTDMNIQDISEKLGFTTKNYFFTFFKKHTGFTPNQYRKEKRKDLVLQKEK